MVLDLCPFGLELSHLVRSNELVSYLVTWTPVFCIKALRMSGIKNITTNTRLETVVLN